MHVFAQLKMRSDMGSYMLHRELLHRKPAEAARRINPLLCRNMCKMLWACLASCFSSCEDGCLLTWSKLKDLKRAKRDSETDTEMYNYSWSDEDLEERISYPRRSNGLKFRRSLSHRSGERRRFHMSRSLRPRSHRVTVGISRRSAYVNERFRPRRHTDCVDAVHNFKVTRTSKFVQKGSGRRVYLKRYR
ncbi:hypothetical protein KSP40_PGU011246 [Platanthera guangdongensis]|uniref:Uncharacterized protein n=1 Tax=Platanthera guangdongensis TaxID=2320717 RepID=A0ABR2MRH4_9ASPA